MIVRTAPSLPAWIEGQLPPGARRSLVHVGEDVHVMEWGEGPPVLMLHGNPTWGFLYRKVVAALRVTELRLIVPDLVGLGFSARVPPAAHTLDNHVRWMGALLDGLGLRDLVFVGQDWGGPIGLGALAERPGLARGLVLLNTVIGPPRPGFRPTAFHRFARMPLLSDVAFRLLGLPQAALHLVQGDRASIRGAVARAYRYPLRGRARNAAPLALARMVPDSFAHPSVGPLRRAGGFAESFPGPVAVVWGDRDPLLGRVRHHLQRVLPRASVTATAAGHFLQEEVPEAIAAAVRRVAGVPA
jgi:haloalkane dehalogenase